MLPDLTDPKLPLNAQLAEGNIPPQSPGLSVSQQKVNIPTGSKYLEEEQNQIYSETI